MPTETVVECEATGWPHVSLLKLRLQFSRRGSQFRPSDVESAAEFAPGEQLRTFSSMGLISRPIDVSVLDDDQVATQICSSSSNRFGSVFVLAGPADRRARVVRPEMNDVRRASMMATGR